VRISRVECDLVNLQRPVFAVCHGLKGTMSRASVVSQARARTAQQQPPAGLVRALLPGGACLVTLTLRDHSCFYMRS
jgi:hypothetical protein